MTDHMAAASSDFDIFNLFDTYDIEWGSPIPFPTGGACVLSVIRFQDVLFQL
jgi:hypothetical protein